MRVRKAISDAIFAAKSSDSSLSPDLVPEISEAALVQEGETTDTKPKSSNVVPEIGKAASGGKAEMSVTRTSLSDEISVTQVTETENQVQD